ncbi:MAG: BamA/TamA family outer membrane protein [Chitinispirillaceae bacterium]
MQLLPLFRNIRSALFLLSFLSIVSATTVRISSQGEITGLEKGRRYYSAFKSLKNLSSQDSQTVCNILDSLGYHRHKIKRVQDTLLIVPGQRVRIKNFSIKGTPSSVSFDNIEFPTFPRFYDAGEISITVYQLSRSLADQGYPFSRIVTSIEPSDSADMLRVVFRIEADVKVCNSASVIKGGESGKELFLRDILLKEGNLFRGGDVEESLRRLRLRPYVTKVDAGAPVIINGSPLGNDSMKAVAVPFYVDERCGMDVEGALGYESGSAGREGVLRGALNLSMINLFHAGENAKIHYTGAETSQRLRISFEKPWIFEMPLFAGGALGLEVEDRGYGYLSGEASLGTEVGVRWRGSITLRGSETVPPDSFGPPYKFYGADLSLSLIPEPYSRGTLVKELSIITGSGVAVREKPYTRNRMELTAGIHVPFGSRYAFAGRGVTQNLFTDEENISPAENYRTGGHESVRGYSEDEFSFRSVAYIQLECLLYFNKQSSLFILLDGGTGFDKPGSYSLSDRKDMLGYGVGVRFPSKMGSVTLEWARNIHDEKSAGRVHMGIKTEL